MTQLDPQVSEKSLIIRLIEDDEEAFGEIYTKYKNRLFYFSMKFVKSKEFAEDICHDTFTSLWQNRHFVDPSLSFSSFLYTIARNRILNVIRDQKNEEKFRENILSQAIDYDDDTNSVILSNELKSVLDIAVSKMTNRQKQVFEMSREKGLSHKEIASELGISVYSVQEHISNSLKLIRSIIRKHYGDSHLSLFTILLLFC